MITGEIRNQIDRIWDAFWSGGISNPMEVIEQMTYLLFIKRLDELHTAREKKANRLKRPIENPLFNKKQQRLRWSRFKSLGSPQKMYETVADEVFPLIQEVQTDEYWQDVTLPILETLRRKLRDLVKFVDAKKRDPVYTVLQDEIGDGETVEIGGFDVGINLAQYRKKVEQFIRSNEDHITIQKLKLNVPLTASDLSELERFLFESGEVQSRDLFERVFGNEEKLSVFIRTLVGLDREAAKKAFSKYLDNTRFNTSQIRFVETIIDHLTQKGIMDAGLLYEQPFTGIHYEGLDGVFPSATANEIVNILDQINANAEVIKAA